MEKSAAKMKDIAVAMSFTVIVERSIRYDATASGFGPPPPS